MAGKVLARYYGSHTGNPPGGRCGGRRRSGLRGAGFGQPAPEQPQHLLAAQVAARVREIFGVALELRSFLETPTVANLARQVEVLVKTRKTGQDTQSEGREEIEL